MPILALGFVVLIFPTTSAQRKHLKGVEILQNSHRNPPQQPTGGDEGHHRSIDPKSTSATYLSPTTTKLNVKMNAIARQSAASASRALRASTQKQQKRGIVSWMTNYPDKVSGISVWSVVFRIIVLDADSRVGFHFHWKFAFIFGILIFEEFSFSLLRAVLSSCVPFSMSN